MSNLPFPHIARDSASAAILCMLRGNGKIVTDTKLPLTTDQEQILVRLQGSMDAYFPEFSTQGAREVVIDAFRQADLTFSAQAAKT